MIHHIESQMTGTVESRVLLQYYTEVDFSRTTGIKLTTFVLWSGIEFSVVCSAKKDAGIPVGLHHKTTLNSAIPHWPHYHWALGYTTSFTVVSLLPGKLLRNGGLGTIYAMQNSKHPILRPVIG